MDIRLVSPQPRLDPRPLARRVGLVILATDHTTEPDYAHMVASERIGVYVARLAYANPTSTENLRAMQPALAETAGLILPGEQLDAICYSCSSASVVIGDEAVDSALSQHRPGVPVVTPTRAACAGLRALGARRISILTPYTVETSAPMARYFEDRGFVITRFSCLGFDDDREMARIAPDEIVRLARETTSADADALFISCTALRAAPVAARIESAIGRPIVSSNQATAWACRRLCGEDHADPRFGRLMTLPYSTR